MRIVIRPSLAPEREIDLTDRIISVIAESLWRVTGGNAQLNWLEAERTLERLMGRRATSPEAPRTGPVSGGAGRARKHRGEGSSVPEKTTRTVLAISGMRGNSCRERLMQALERLDGVRDVDVSLHRTLAVVVHETRCPVATLLQAIEDAGFKAAPIPVRSVQLRPLTPRANPRRTH